jgi:hypothetical protein
LHKLGADPRTAGYVGAPTVFLSHAWDYKFRKVLSAMRNYVDTLPEAAPTPLFWFDCFSLDQHATQDRPQEWWSSTFQDAIRGIGCTLMVLSPWHKPLPLTRAWCLWELFSTHKVGVKFEVTLGREEQRAFERELLHDSGVVLKAFAEINVANAEAGEAADREMILTAVREDVGCDALNAIVFERMRSWIVGVARRLLEDPATTAGGRNQISALFLQQGLLPEAAEVATATLARQRQQLGSEHADTAATTLDIMAQVHNKLGNYDEALRLYERALKITMKALGPEHADTAATLHSMAQVHDSLGNYDEALRLYERAL